jgi:hypothetical protein
MHPAFLDRGGRLRGDQRGDMVAVGLHDALGRPRGARGIHDRRNVLGAAGGDALGQRRLVRLGLIPSRAAQRLPRHHRRRGLGRVVPAHHDDVLEVGNLLARLQHLGELGGILDEHRPGAGVLEHVGDEIRRIARIDRYCDAAGAEDGEVRLHPLGPAGRQQRHRVALGPAERDQPQRQLAHGVADLAPRARLPGPGLLELLRRPLTAALDSTPEHLGKRVFRHMSPPTCPSNRPRQHATTTANTGGFVTLSPPI